MTQRHCDIGIIGLGVMGRNLARNIADHHFEVTGYDKDADAVKKLGDSATGDLKEFVGGLKPPRRVMMLVPAGKIVDAVIGELRSLLSTGDIILDCGNSHFSDSDRRREELFKRGIHYLGVGVSGGERGARNGPSIMPGGDRDAYESVRPILEKIAAHVGDDPCVTYLGPGSAGHYVKMVHNGIEYGLMQLIAETYDLMRRGLKMSEDEMHDVYAGWSDSYLLEITQKILKRKDERTGQPLLNVIRDVADQKGTGMWTSQEAMKLHAPTPTIDVAVIMRNFSELVDTRETAGRFLHGLSPSLPEDLAETLGDAYNAAALITYAQGLALLRMASEEYGYRLQLRDVVRIWRGGCIIRAAVLDKFLTALRNQPDLPNILFDEELAREVSEGQSKLREVIRAAVAGGVPVPALSASLAYFDAYRSPRWPANLIQAQRDCFGGHTYRRIDAEGSFHTDWLEE